MKPASLIAASVSLVLASHALASYVYTTADVGGADAVVNVAYPDVNSGNATQAVDVLGGSSQAVYLRFTPGAISGETATLNFYRKKITPASPSKSMASSIPHLARIGPKPALLLTLPPASSPVVPRFPLIRLRPSISEPLPPSLPLRAPR
jgi:hypothetical protein